MRKPTKDYLRISECLNHDRIQTELTFGHLCGVETEMGLLKLSIDLAGREAVGLPKFAIEAERNETHHVTSK